MKNFRDIIMDFPLFEREKLMLEIAHRCCLELRTVEMWVLGKRHPRQRSKVLATDLLVEKGLVEKGCEVNFRPQ
jgi:hypothetical protein